MRSWWTFILVAILSSAVWGYELVDYQWEMYEGHQYTLTMDWHPWLDAEAEAAAIGGHLVTINNAEENDWLAETYRDVYTQDPYDPLWCSAVWIGLEYVSGDIADPASWAWVSGEPVTFWNPIQDPGYFDVGEHMYMHTNSHWSQGTWNNDPQHDVVPGEYFRGIIEIPEPGTIILLGIGSLPFLRKRRKVQS